jgi:ribosomal-protein-alanine acetyltransferase
VDDAEAVAHTERLARADGWSPAAILDSLRQPHTHGWVCTAEEHVVGHVLTRVVAAEAEILTIAVRPTYRRRGVGRTLLDECCVSWRRDGVHAAYLEVRASNHGARALYTANGWSETGARHGYYRDGEAAIILRWSPQCS